jgi:hypothetical protein
MTSVQKFNKKVQVDPYLEDALCSTCHLKQVSTLCPLKKDDIRRSVCRHFRI